MIEPIEISAPTEAVWSLLRQEAQSGIDAGQATLLHEVRERELLLEVQMGVGFRVQHAYRLERHGERCLISDRVRPIGWRWRLSNIFLFGRGLRAIEAAALQGLLNLRTAAEERGDGS
ncbi:MAG: hypothetical protein F4Y04_00160 [Chloroflexi bacterium]|nr:hypothetical protein [Chloroflexota bacterium]